MKRLSLTMKEAQKYKVIKRVAEGRSSRARACITLKLSDRQVRRLLDRYSRLGKSAFRPAMLERPQRIRSRPKLRIASLGCTQRLTKILISN